MTPGIMDLVKHFQLPTHAFIARHQAGDWSEMSEEDAEENRLSIKEGRRVFSAFIYKPQPDIGINIWIITEADRSSTTVLLPEEY
ncbi:MAG: hypothetical protein D4R63_09995 [Methylococcaceae bacterium]|nr:MAG: hypothetical protein D4R63_09995 [Methylococcaceae bacterium]